MDVQPLIVVSSSRWVADDFASTGYPVEHQMGFDLPAAGQPLWCAGSFMNRVLASGARPPAQSPGIRLLDGQTQLLGREVYSFKPVNPPESLASGSVFIKPAEAKLGTLPARVYRDYSVFEQALEDFWHQRRWSTDQVNQLSFLASEVTSWEHEFRCFVAHGKVVASSFYLDFAGRTWDMFDPDDAPDSLSAAVWAQSAVDKLAQVHAEPEGVGLPDGFVLDVGHSCGRYSVIEANASWSSNPYHCRMDGVLASVLASQQPNQHWQWTPDQPLLAAAKALPVR